MKESRKGLTRRSFLKTTGLAALSAPVFSARSYGRIIGANDRLQAGIIGCGGMARAHLNALLELKSVDNVDVVAVCDVYESRAQHFAELVAGAEGNAVVETQYERVLEIPDLDYVTIATPEHWHSRMTLDALDTGLHVYVEKPMTHKLEEAFEVADKARSTGLKVQVGVQGMSDESYTKAHEAILAGKLGPVIQAQIDYVRWHPAEQGPWRTGIDRAMPKPDDLDWERWLGSAPQVPWSPSRYFEWRNYRDYSGGIASDLFIHRLSRLMRACGLTRPTQVSGMGGIFLWEDDRDLPDNLEMLALYPAVEGVTPGMTVHLLGTMGNDRGNSHMIRGHKASLVFTRQGWDILAQGSDEIVESYVKTGGERVDLHHQNHHAAIRDGVPLHCPPEFGLDGVIAITGVNESWFQKRSLTWSESEQRWV